uniref:Uncharacterized protein n=2 Tax=Lepeophtheirus salmonis TaxID=72036 RepID=A0A0K2SZE1_LEPSM
MEYIKVSKLKHFNKYEDATRREINFMFEGIVFNNLNLRNNENKLVEYLLIPVYSNHSKYSSNVSKTDWLQFEVNTVENCPVNAKVTPTNLEMREIFKEQMSQ